MHIQAQDMLEQAGQLLVAAELAEQGRLSSEHGQAATLAGLSMLFSYFAQVEFRLEAATEELG